MKNLLPKIFFGLSILALAAVIFIIIKGGKDSSLRGEVSLPVKEGEKIVIDEYSDFQCPACAQLAPILKELKQKYPDKIEVRFHHYAIPYHRWSKKAGEASEAARQQEKFWDYHDLLFERQDEWPGSSDAVSLFKKYAQDLNLDLAKFNSDLDSGKFAKEVEKQTAEGNEKKIDSTPTVFVNGQKVEGFKSWEEFKTKMEEKIR